MTQKTKHSKLILDEENLNAVEKILDYLEQSEQNHYEEQFEDPESPTEEELEFAEDHILTSVIKIRKLLTKSMVFQALNRGKENGYDCFSQTALQEASDLTSFDKSLESYSPEGIEPYVLEWRKENNTGDFIKELLKSAIEEYEPALKALTKIVTNAATISYEKALCEVTRELPYIHFRIHVFSDGEDSRIDSPYDDFYPLNEVKEATLSFIKQAKERHNARIYFEYEFAESEEGLTGKPEWEDCILTY